jgi:hypothetical protein
VPLTRALSARAMRGSWREFFRAWLLDECAWLQSQMLFFLGQGTAEVALHLFRYLALLVVEQLARGESLWRERGRWFFDLNMASITNPRQGNVRATSRVPRMGRTLTLIYSAAKI